MAGPAREEERSYKKAYERRDPKRKNSFGRGISSSFNSSPAPAPGPNAFPHPRHIPEHAPLNDFNAQESVAYLNRGWSNAFDQLHNSSLSEHDKPILHKSAEKAWSNRNSFASAWGPKACLMASGENFLDRLEGSKSKADH
ncbi:hypothetical protein K493DRAFT_63667 [Basidiobolus meristosporus CBS 931.73]|uniref:Uncharacterized protein n=1 Tax=Basidiobolus meristosporus CBS 931.73 TaxID=1314790 RepID=A0A1Y1Z0R9_9FUNG|nr:hypothetical protein K493DRAFT_63667 [Basidiobolus meristosporus CBS 931.73]|eukprot:ORY03891.1 hypothetical protein K493DRAFT_63667 [Basidiobolus meristosporus CBS 931.73]